jgi:sugar phosphate isomerase/epimerase
MLTGQTSYLAVAPMVPNRSPISAAHVRTLIDAAADAGFSGVEFWMNHHDWAFADGMSSEEFFDYYRDRGLSLIAAELTDKWATPDRQAVTEGTAHLLELAARAGASSVLAVARELPSFDDAATGLGHFCDLAGERGLGVSLELVPFGGVTNIATFARMLEMVDRDNLGLCLDAWHWHRQRGGPDIPTLRTIPADRIHLLQLDDAAAQPADDLLVETMTARLLPGEGAADIQGLLDVLDEMGASPAVVSEVFSSSLAALEPGENARRQYAAVQAVFSQRNVSSHG